MATINHVLQRHAVHYLKSLLQLSLERTSFIESVENELDELRTSPLLLDLNTSKFTHFNKDLPNILLGIDRLYQSEQWKLVIAAAHSISDLLHLKGQTSLAIEYTNLGLEAAQKTNSERAIAELSYFLSVLHLHQSNYTVARQLCDLSRITFEDLNDTYGNATSSYQLAIIAYHKEKFEQSKDLCEASLLIFRKLKDKKGVSSCLHMLGTLSLLSGEYSEAESQYQASLTIKIEIGDKINIAHTLFQLSYYEYLQGNYDSALEKSLEALKIKQDLSYEAGIARSLFQQGNILFAKKDIINAQIAIEKSLQMRRISGDKKGEAIICEKLGFISGNEEETQRYLTQALTLNQGIGNKIPIAKNTYNLGLLFEKDGKYQQAYEAYL